MKRALLVPLAATACCLTVAACGSHGIRDTTTTSGSDATPTAGSSQQSAACGPRANADYAPLAHTDFDGDGKADDPMVVAGTGSCPKNELYAVVDGRPATLDLGSDQLASTGQSVQLPDRKGQLLMVRSNLARGGFQVHLFAYADGKLAELTHDGAPLVPFVATDTPGTAGVSATCGNDTVIVTQDKGKEGEGGEPATALVRVTYRIAGTTATEVASVPIRDDGSLTGKHTDHTQVMPESTFFDKCLAPSAS